MNMYIHIKNAVIYIIRGATNTKPEIENRVEQNLDNNIAS